MYLDAYTIALSVEVPKHGAKAKTMITIPSTETMYAPWTLRVGIAPKLQKPNDKESVRLKDGCPEPRVPLATQRVQVPNIYGLWSQKPVRALLLGLETSNIRYLDPLGSPPRHPLRVKLRKYLETPM